jgi:hypothetical protein
MADWRFEYGSVNTSARPQGRSEAGIDRGQWQRGQSWWKKEMKKGMLHRQWKIEERERNNCLFIGLFN